MVKLAVVKTGGKQYLVRENDEIVVDKIDTEAKKELKLAVLATFEDDGKTLNLGTPTLKETIKAMVVEHGKGDKVRVAKFKAKVRYRKVMGFRAQLTKLKIGKI